MRGDKTCSGLAPERVWLQATQSALFWAAASVSACILFQSRSSLFVVPLPSSVAMAAHQRRTHAQLAVGATGGRERGREGGGLSMKAAASRFRRLAAHLTYQPTT